MPFTLVHPAIILPLKYLPKKWISLTALIVGSVMPDLESFLRLRPVKDITHTWAGFLYLGLPAGVLLSFFFHNIIRDPVIANLPSFFQKRFSKSSEFNWTKKFTENWFTVIVSMVIGGASHFFWDSFTHYGWFLRRFPRLKGDIVLFESNMEVRHVLQYVNSILGLLIILFFIVKIPSTQKVSPSRYFVPFWFLTMIIATAFFAVRMDFLSEKSMDGFIITSVSAFLFGLCSAAIIFGKTRPI